jgi:hypothetical protein
VLKRIILIILLYLPVSAHGGFWEALGACFTDPCNCGDGNPTRWEDWNGEHINKGKKNRVCPPWNKGGGRNNHTCLVKAPFPKPFIAYYQNLCAEEAPESNYFTPKIRIRGQQCNFAACWTTKDSLRWDGQCKTLAGGYGLPLHRMCARIAIPANYAANFPQDPGYTAKVHLNYEGATVHDDPIIGYDGRVLSFDPPKLCAYYDPAFLSFKDGFDLMDLDPGKQSYHKTKELHPVIKVIIFFFEIATQSDMSPFQMLGSLFSMLTGGDQGMTTFIKILGDIFDYMSFLIKLIGQVIIALLKEIGQINRAVDSTIYGCVKIPMGPYPPPFCPIIGDFFETAYTQKICQKDSSGEPVDSVSEAECVVSTLDNNFVRNSVRVTFKNYVPLCKNGEDPLVTDKCVVLDNIGGFGTPTQLHILTAKTDILPPCIGAPSGSVCVKTKIPHTCSVAANGCGTGFRVVYGRNIGGVITPEDYFQEDVPDCPSSSSIGCQQLWGINTSEFADISLIFPPVQMPSDIMPLVDTVSMKDKAGRSASFSVSIVRTSSFDETLGLSREPNQICVTQGDEVVGCEDRTPFTKPTVYDCTNPLAQALVNCSSSYFAPRFVATVTDGLDSTSAVISPLSVYNALSAIEGLPVNLAGYNFDSFVTDDSLVRKPFSGSKSPNPGSLFGTYQNNVSPLRNDLSENPDAIYISGLEYINDKYHLGGKYACLEPLDIDKCPANIKNCVLSRLDNTNIVSCETFIGKLAQYAGLSMCTSAQASSCNIVAENITGGGGTVSIRSCGANSGIYCYTSPGSVDICKISNDPTRRYLPNPALGAILSDSQYFDITTTSPGYQYDKDLYSLRDKTPYEMNLCTTIPQPTCAATFDYNAESGFASWPETPVGSFATGTCQPGLNPVAPLQRRCIPDPDNQTFKFEPLYSISGGNRVYTNVKCQ